MLYSQGKTVAHADKLRNMCVIYTGLINFLFVFFFCFSKVGYFYSKTFAPKGSGSSSD